MIFRRYGSHFESVRPNFNPTAMTEIGFQRDRALSIPVHDFESGYELVEEGKLTAEADHEVQKEAEHTVLQNLEAELSAWRSRLEGGQVLVILNDRNNQPKTRERRETKVVKGENRFHFHWWVEPPLEVGIYGPV